MKRIGEIAAGAVKSVVAPVAESAIAEADTSASSAVRFVFGRMHGAYGTQWLDKWRTGVVDKRGRDMGVASAMSDWAIDLAPFDQATIARACEIVQDEARRKEARFAPSKPEFMAECRALQPRRPPPLALPSKVTDEEKQLARDRLAALREASLIDKPKLGPLERLQDAITEAVILAGGQYEDLTMWNMVRT